jgi:hypothetical protein
MGTPSWTRWSSPFILDLTALSGSIKSPQPLFSPIESSPTLTITVDASSNNAVVWDGKGISGQMVESAENYTVSATVRDEFGNASDLNSIIPRISQ